MLVDPVPTPLPRRNPLAPPASAENHDEALPLRPPTVTPCRREAIRLRPSRHAAEVSDTHHVRSQALPPVRAPTHDELSPRPSPCTVTLAPPVPPALDRVPLLSAADPAECTPVALPVSRPTVCDSLMLPSTDDCPARQVTHVSASHHVPSHDDGCRRTAALSPVSPSPAPYTVITSDPVALALLDCTPLALDRPAEKSPVVLPARIPPVNASLALPLLPSVASDCTALSDTHAVSPHLVAPVLAADDNSPTPMPEPPTVKLTDPVAAPFASTVMLNLAASPDTAPVTLPRIKPAVTRSFLLPITPHAERHCSDVSDTHLLDSQAVPIRAAAELPLRPTFAPWIVKTDEPLAA